MNRKRSLLLAVATAAAAGAGLTFVRAQAQDPPTPPGQGESAPLRCATPTPDPVTLRAVEEDLRRFQLQSGVAPLRVTNIRVVVHNIQATSGEGYVSDAQIKQQIAVLNRSFSGNDGPAPGQMPSAQRTANSRFRFVLADIDRWANNRWFTMDYASGAEESCKRTLHVGNAKTLNIYLVKPPGGLLGWATFPWEYRDYPWRDGVVIHYASLPDGGLSPYNLGDTATHEIGHWLGLYHTFQDGCSRNNDFVSDTPSEKDPFYGAPPPYRNSCRAPGRDPLENFMDYTNDAYMFQFTRGQAKRMSSMAQRHRGL